jgi:hypothetical protein
MYDVSDELAALLRAARREPGPDGTERRRMWSAIEQSLSYGPPASNSPPPLPVMRRQQMVLLRAR